MSARALTFEPDKIRKYAKVITAVGHRVDRFWHRMNTHNPVKFRYLLRDHYLEGSGHTEKEKLWVRRINLAEKVGAVVGAKVDNIEIEAVLEEAEIAELQILETDAGNPGLVKSIAARVKRKSELENLFRRYRFNYEDMDYFTSSMDRVELVLGRIAELKKYKIPVTREALYSDVFEVASAIGIMEDENLSPEQMEVVVYLENAGCDPFWARKLARSGEGLEDFRAKVDFLRGVRLEVEDYGKTILEISDYETLLDRPIAHIKRFELRNLKSVLRNRFARLRLQEALGDQFALSDGWRAVRTSKVTMWAKLNLLRGDVLNEQDAIVAELVTAYSKDSLEGTKKVPVFLG